MMRSSSKRLFFLAVGFSVFLSLFYFSYSTKIVNENNIEKILLNDKAAQRKREAEEKIRLEARVMDEYDELSKVPLEKPYILHHFDENGNITEPISKPFLFLHVPKTAGSTLSSVFKRNEKASKFLHTWTHPKPDDMPKVAAKTVVFGHFRYGLHLYFKVPCTYMTVLREPVDRVVSHYYYHRQHKKDPGHELAMNLTFEQWIMQSPAGNNEQTRFLAGARSQFVITERILEIAIWHMRQMAIVGLTEKYHETLFFLKYIAGFSINKYRPINKGVKRPKVDSVPPATIELIKKNNWADIKLYALAKEIFEKQYALMPPQYHEDLEEFEKLMTRKKPPTNSKKMNV